MLFLFNFTLEYREVYPHTIYGNSRDGNADTFPCGDCMQVSLPGLLPLCWQRNCPGGEIMQNNCTREPMPWNTRLVGFTIFRGKFLGEPNLPLEIYQPTKISIILLVIKSSVWRIQKEKKRSGK